MSIVETVSDRSTLLDQDAPSLAAVAAPLSEYRTALVTLRETGKTLRIERMESAADLDHPNGILVWREGKDTSLFTEFGARVVAEKQVICGDDFVIDMPVSRDAWHIAPGDLLRAFYTDPRTGQDHEDRLGVVARVHVI